LSYDVREQGISLDETEGRRISKKLKLGVAIAAVIGLLVAVRLLVRF